MSKEERYEPLLRRIDSWIWYQEHMPKSDYKSEPQVHDAFRSAHDLDCVLLDGDLNADTIFSLWLPLRFTLKSIHGYARLRSLGNINHKYLFLKALRQAYGTERFKTLFPLDDERILALLTLFELGQTRANVMRLPDRRMQARGMAPYYDYVPYFLYECFANGAFSAYFGSDDELVTWIHQEALTMFFKQGEIKPSTLCDLSESGSIQCGIPLEHHILDYLQNYIACLQERSEKLNANAHGG